MAFNKPEEIFFHYSRLALSTILVSWVDVFCAHSSFIRGCSFRYVLGVEGLFVPPLQPQENMGQFGFLTLYMGFFGVLFGVSLGFANDLGLARWHVLFAGLVLSAQALEPMDPCYTSGCAVFVTWLIALPFGALAYVSNRYVLDRDSVKDIL